MDCNTSLIQLEQQCYGRGVCINSSSSSSQCDCKAPYIEESYCRLTRTEYVNYVDIVLYSIVTAIHLSLLILTILEIIIDLVLHRKLSWKRPAVVAKFFLVLLFTGRGFNLVLTLHSWLNPSVTYAQYSLKVLSVLSLVGVAACHSLVSISWITTLLTAKSMSNPVHMIRFRRASFIVLFCILLPIYAILKFSSLFLSAAQREKSSDVINLLENLMLLFIILLIVCGTSFHIIQMLKWTCEKKDSELMMKASKKTIYLLLGNICNVAVVIEGLSTLAFKDPNPWQRLCTSPVNLILLPPSVIVSDWIIKLLEVSIGLADFFFLENYLTRFGFLRGYIIAFQGDLVKIRLSTAFHTDSGLNAKTDSANTQNTTRTTIGVSTLTNPASPSSTKSSLTSLEELTKGTNQDRLSGSSSSSSTSASPDAAHSSSLNPPQQFSSPPESTSSHSNSSHSSYSS